MCNIRCYVVIIGISVIDLLIEVIIGGIVVIENIVEVSGFFGMFVGK